MASSSRNSTLPCAVRASSSERGKRDCRISASRTWCATARCSNSPRRKLRALPILKRVRPPREVRPRSLAFGRASEKRGSASMVWWKQGSRLRLVAAFRSKGWHAPQNCCEGDGHQQHRRHGDNHPCAHGLAGNLAGAPENLDNPPLKKRLSERWLSPRREEPVAEPHERQ